MSRNNPQVLHNAYTCQTCIKMSFSAILDILAFIPHIFILDNFGCQHLQLYSYANYNKLTVKSVVKKEALQNIFQLPLSELAYEQFCEIMFTCNHYS
jgi:hypothetical protein